MAKFSPHSRLSQQQEQEILLDFFQSLATLKGFKEATEVFQDLLSRAELTMLAKRLKIAKLLIKGVTYQEISRTLKVSTQTIARVNIWLQEAGEGFRLMFERTKTKSNSNHRLPNTLWSSFKRRYPMYYWPELLMREIIATANRRQKERLRKVLSNLQVKGKLHRELGKLLHSS